MMGGARWQDGVFILVLVVAYFMISLVLGLGRAGPDLLTVAVLIAARRLSGAQAAGLGLALGLMRDALSLSAFGASAVLLTLLGFLGARSRDLFVGDSLLFIGVYLFVGKWVYDALYFLLVRDAFREPAMEFLLMGAPLAALYASAVGVAALFAYRTATHEI